MHDPSPERLRSLFETTLRKRLDALERYRLTVRQAIFKAALLVAPPFLLMVLSGTVAGWVGLPEIAVAALGFVLLIAAIVIAAMRWLVSAFTAQSNYQARFKREILTEIFQIAAPGARYEPFEGIAESVFDASGLFRAGGYQSDDRVRGKVGTTPFEVAEIRRAVRTGWREKARTHTVFKGLFFHFGVDRRLRGTTIVQPRSIGGFQAPDRSHLNELRFDDPRFAEGYRVFSSDESETRALLAPTLLHGIATLRERTGHPIFLSWREDRVYVAVHYDRALFEPNVLGQTTYDALEEMAAHFALTTAVVRDLGLSDETSLSPPDEHPLFESESARNRPDAPDLTTGNLTESDVWRAANTEAGASEGESGDAPRPVGTRVDVRQDANSLTIAYGLPVSFFAAIALTGLSLIVFSKALRAAGVDARGLDAASGWLGSLVTVTLVEDWVHAHPRAWLIGAFLSAIFTAFVWMTRVRRVVIDRERVSIYRGLRPFPRRYARPLYERIVQLDRAVHVGKTNSTGLMNPSASPILASSEEAGWVASEMRRALRRTR